MDPANLAATFFAVLSLGFVENVGEVRRNQCLGWLRRLQREDGSFGELVTEDGRIHGGADMRYCYVAVAIRWMLIDEANEKGGEGDIDVEKLVEYLRGGQVC